MPKIESEKIDCLHRPCSRPAPRGKIQSYARTQKSSNSLIRFRCSNSSFLLETGIAGNERLLLAKWHPKAEKKLRRRPFSTSLTGMKSCTVQRPRTPWNRRCSFAISSLPLTFQWKTECMQRWPSDFQGLFRVKIRKMAQGSNDLSTLPLNLIDHN